MKEKRHHKNAFALIFLIVFFGGYTFFFTSKLWMPTAGDASRLTKLGQDIFWNDRTIRIIRWDYAEKQHTMEVELDISNSSFDGIESYRYTALETNEGELPVTPIIEEMDWVILQIQDVPQKFAEISLRIEMPSDETAGMVRLYTNRNDVSHVNNLEVKDKAEYLAMRYENEIEGYKQNIEDFGDTIQKSEDRIRAIKKEIEQLKQKEEYQTDEQIKETEEIIGNAENKILEEESDIAVYQSNIEELYERIENLEKQIQKLSE